MPTRKFINQPENLVSELLEGFVLAHPDKIKLAGSNLVVRAKEKSKDKVAVVTIGGSGHEPALSGYVGEGMLDISVPGDIFAAPGPPRVVEALEMANRKAGVLFVVLNHAGDVMSANVAMQMAKSKGLKVKDILTHEDISAPSRQDPKERRGLAGCFFVIKVAGAAAEKGYSLDQCFAVAERMEKNMATLAVAVAGASHPATGQVIAEVPDGRMNVGMGQHGEAGTGEMDLKTADQTAEVMLNMLCKDLAVKKGEQLLVMINGVGSTTLMEMYIVLRRVKQLCDAKGIKLARSLVGEYLTVQEMGGFQMCIARMDKELLELWDAPCRTPALTMK
ncbi:MAG: dihydroxyacetone kinase subunit DhaK [Sedimentisphaerales bacterium]|nr:dihydroxyacetone kinase subunit DhaK [Sedimentisphaerales bacterium]